MMYKQQNLTSTQRRMTCRAVPALSKGRTGQFAIPCKISKLGSVSTNAGTAEGSISILKESVFLGNRTMAYLQISPLRDSRDETFCVREIRKRSVSWNLQKLSQLRWCNGRFG
jgi:hypothetical protein